MSSMGASAGEQKVAGPVVLGKRAARGGVADYFMVRRKKESNNDELKKLQNLGRHRLLKIYS